MLRYGLPNPTVGQSPARDAPNIDQDETRRCTWRSRVIRCVDCMAASHVVVTAFSLGSREAAVALSLDSREAAVAPSLDSREAAVALSLGRQPQEW